jgi:hypothetical protein
MANQQWVSLLVPSNSQATGAGTAFTSAASGNAVLSPQTSVANQDVAVVNQPGQYLGWYAGMLIRVTARGFFSPTTTTGTLTFLLSANKNNSTAPGSQTTLATANGITTGATAITGIQFKIEALIRCTSIASSGNTVSTQGELILGNSGAAVPANPIALTGTSGVGPLFLPNASGETAAAIDTTQNYGINLRCTTTAASGTVQCTQWLVEALN